MDFDNESLLRCYVDEEGETKVKEWCEANDAVYKKSHWSKWDFKALILIKGLGPVRDNSPFDEDVTPRRPR